MKGKLLSILLIVSLSLCLMALTGCGASTAKEPVQPKQIDLKPGEIRYSGTSSAEKIKSISVSFILSADKSSIRGFTISVTDFKGTAKISGATVSVEIPGQTQTMMKEISVDYEGDNQDISVGDNSIESLKFMEDGSADLVFTYCYKELTPQAYEIPVPGIKFKLTSEQ